MKNKWQHYINRRLILVLVLIFGVLFLFYAAIYSNILLQYLFNEKIWVHRVNSIEKLKEVNTKFSGVELDVVFDDNLGVFDITHPPEPSIKLTLEDYLKSNDTHNLKFWLDFKNLDTSNLKLALNRLNIIAKKHNINTQDVIVESSNPILLNAFQEIGFKTSYYLPWPGLYKLNNNQQKKMISKIKQEILENKITCISSNYHDYETMKKEFPTLNKLLWVSENDYHYKGIKERIFLYKILRDKKVDVLLMQYNSNAKNR